MKRTGLIILLLIFSAIFFIACEKDNTEPKELIFPIGRSFLNTSSVKITVGNKLLNPHLLFDSCGGYWIQISALDIPDNEKMTITITRKKGDLNLFHENGNKQSWISSSYYIDSDNEKIVSKAKELTTGLSSTIEKATAIQKFVINHVKLNIYRDAFLDKASKTYELGYGTCMNFSRLYVALCRAAKIPARTIWGVVYGFNNDNVYDYHHQWAEILDDSGNWHPCDFNYTTNFDLKPQKYRFEVMLAKKWQSPGIGIYKEQQNFIWWAGTKEYYKLEYDFIVKE